mmetsp:Transcript_7498/g.21910  ORF Transcript_7498/g.21910 Transcript_7498/m.21910 type:complete len:340 (-) Transcript_7498:115-1134(-)|eukprot:CAMPEP_0119558370 /NCGR_PEP_ID=MMETSP1352-20130426/10737_1 /TAXON_ID=265584 /ORGANISM="Stauroneis constricta, Strain CCMP1120" /LENGTH=339 /DNA_ID=CAMNT_0007605713 /DNA_START=247 /DNA_END=1266 /DNA_ORIENTATION=+
MAKKLRASASPNKSPQRREGRFISGLVIGIIASAIFFSNQQRLLESSSALTSDGTSATAVTIEQKTVEAPPPIGDLEKIVAQCKPITEEERQGLQREIRDYEGQTRFHQKIQEVEGKRKTDAHHVAIDKYLKERVLRPGWSVLELGCAAGTMLQMVKRAYAAGIGDHGDFVGVELVTGWVRFAEKYFADKGISVFEGDITNFALPAPFAEKTFDFVMLNDVAEHIQKARYGCFFNKLREVTHEGSIVYVHTPNPQAQLVDAGQFYENVLPHHVFVTGMAYAKFELVALEQDVDTQCSDRRMIPQLPTMMQNTGCAMNWYPKYYHAVFRRVDGKKVFNLA